MEEGIASCSQIFLNEIALLKAMFSSDELVLPEDERPLAEGRDTQILLRLAISDLAIELVVQCSAEYPLYSKPHVLVRCNESNSTTLNQQLRAFVDSAPLGEPLIMSVVQWLQDNLRNFVIDRESRIISSTQSGDEEKFARYWIYTHHLRSSVKRRNIEAVAKMLQLNGFSCPGKPSVIIVEGHLNDCQQFWETIRSWTWKHIVVRHKEESSKRDGFLRLHKFHEVIFASNDGRRIELAELKNYLRTYDLDYGFPI
uniref:RWD domain-containing protein n=1 Tax=Parascaris univalens TaxID=6257 RepID=A0A915CJK7_PARUN